MSLEVALCLAAEGFCLRLREFCGAWSDCAREVNFFLAFTRHSIPFVLVWYNDGMMWADLVWSKVRVVVLTVWFGLCVRRFWCAWCLRFGWYVVPCVPLLISNFVVDELGFSAEVCL